MKWPHVECVKPYSIVLVSYSILKSRILIVYGKLYWWYFLMYFSSHWLHRVSHPQLCQDYSMRKNTCFSLYKIFVRHTYSHTQNIYWERDRQKDRLTNRIKEQQILLHLEFMKLLISQSWLLSLTCLFPVSSPIPLVISFNSSRLRANVFLYIISECIYLTFILSNWIMDPIILLI